MYVIKRYIIDVWQGSEYTIILNMLALHTILKKCWTIDSW